MDTGERCRECGHWQWGRHHECPPLHDVQDVLGGCHAEDEWDAIHARSPRDAAERWAQRHDEGGDYDIVNGSPATLRVRLSGTSEWQTFVVHGETVPDYTAHLQEPSGG